MENNSIQTNPASNIAESEEKINEGFLKIHENNNIDYKVLAIEKLDTERKAMKPGANTAVGVMYIETCNALRSFCEQNDLFAEVLYKTKRTFADCMEEVAKNPGRGISDIDAYRRAVQFYFPNAQIEFLMNITLEGEAPDDAYIQQESKKKKESASKPKTEKKPAKRTTEKTSAQKKEATKRSETSKKEKSSPTTMQLSLF